MDREVEKFESLYYKLASISSKQSSKDNLYFTDLISATANAKKQYLLSALDFVKQMNLIQFFVSSIVPEKIMPCLKDIKSHLDTSKSALEDLICKLNETVHLIILFFVTIILVNVLCL